ncbi:putative L-ascorbate peroxidase 6 [Sesamum alatum]|uniref:L-ascorbate peroxidase 6 n=1 Tax=Sesamum alatum TaxID=300844 RepID=A0AAE2CHB1_9LAMI|nr:putative L-ascorbate peroxidase 6 [Sesamum alatum]
MSWSTAALDPSLLRSATSLSARTHLLRLPARNLPPLKCGRKTLTLASASASACAASSPYPLIGRRALMYMATTSFLLPSPSFAAATDEMSLLQEEIRKVLSKGKAAGLLRLVFHDAGTFDMGDRTGGMNGSIVYELDRPENMGLKKSVKILEKAKVQVDAIRPVSWADFIAVAGAEAVLVCGGPKIPVQLGRVDAKVPDPEGKLPEESLDATTMKQCFQRKGFSTQELVALSGAHTLGSKGFGNPTVFDNSYFKILLEKPWSSSDGMSSMIGLPSDRALVEDDECMRWISKYADDQNLFFEDFKNVYIKLVNTGAEWTRSL